jgi:plastocyanin
MSARFLTPVAIGVAIVIGWSCGNPSGQGNGCASTGADVTISTKDNPPSFDKPSPTITRGQRVCWQNPGSVAHTVTATSASPADPSWTDSTFDATLNAGGVAIHTFSSAGLYQYHCRIHPGMTASINVP